MAIDVSERVGVREFPPWLREVMLVYGEKPSSLINILRSIDEAACESGVTLAASRRSVCLVAAALRRLVKAQTSPRAAATPCGLTLTLAIPEMTVPLKKLQVLLERLGSSSLFSEVKVAKGLAMLDGALQWKLSQAAVLGENVLSWIKKCAYQRLEHLTTHLRCTQELCALLSSITPASLPALHTLVLEAPPELPCTAGFGPLQHSKLSRLVLRGGVEMEGGFQGLRQLEGLQSLSLHYDDEEGPEVNLDATLDQLSHLELSHLTLSNLACDEGLTSLRHLTSLSMAPGADTYIAVEQLPCLQSLCVDFSSECRGWEVLHAGCVVCIPKAHGLVSLTHLELRSLEWAPLVVGAREAGEASSMHSMGHSAALYSGGSNAGEGEEGGVGAEAEDGGDAVWESDAEVSDAQESDPGAGSMGSNSDDEVDDEGVASLDDPDEEEQGEENDAVSGAASDESALDGAASGAEASVAGGSDSEDGVEEEVVEEMSDAEAALGGEGDGTSETEEEDGVAYAMPEAKPVGKRGSEEADAKAAAQFENRYLGELVRRIPSLRTVHLPDYMGPLPGAAAFAPLEDPPPLRLGRTRQATAARHAHTPLRLWPDGSREYVTLCHIAGTAWQRSVRELPVPGGISQYDLRYTKLE